MGVVGEQVCINVKCVLFFPLECLLDLEPVIRNYNDVSIIEGILQIKRVSSFFFLVFFLRSVFIKNK